MSAKVDKKDNIPIKEDAQLKPVKAKLSIIQTL